MHSRVSTILQTGNLHIQFNGNTSLPLNQHPEGKGLCSYEVLLRAQEVSQHDGATPSRVESFAGSSGVVPATSAGEQLRKSRTDCMKTRNISRRGKNRHKGLKHPHQELERLHQWLEHFRKKLETSHQELHLAFHPETQLLLRTGSNLLFDSGRYGCTASRGRQYEIQSKRRIFFRQHARQASIGGSSPSHGSRFNDFGLTREGTGEPPRKDQAHTTRERRQITATARIIIRGRRISII